MKIKNESFDLMKKVMDSKETKDDSVKAIMTTPMKAAYDEHIFAEKHIQEVNKELLKRVKSIPEGDTEFGKLVDNMYTKKLKLDESMVDFSISNRDKK